MSALKNGQPMVAITSSVSHSADSFPKGEALARPEPRGEGFWEEGFGKELIGLLEQILGLLKERAAGVSRSLLRKGSVKT